MVRYALLLLLVLALGSAAGAAAQPSTSQPSGRHITTSDGVQLYVMVKGEGTACLYIHGGPGSGSYWLEKFSGQMLEKKFRMVYLDQRGTARSTSPANGDYSLARMAQDFEEVRAALGIQQWLTLGHSLGGAIQMGYYQRHPKAITGMMMINCSLSMEDSLRRSWLPKAVAILGLVDTALYEDETVPLLKRLGALSGQLQKQDLMWKMGYASQENERRMAATFTEIPNWNNDFSNAAMSLPDYWEDFRKGTDQVTVPVLFFYGKSDWMVGPEHYKQVHFPHMLLWGSDVGHVASLENPQDLEHAINSYRTKYNR